MENYKETLKNLSNYFYKYLLKAVHMEISSDAYAVIETIDIDYECDLVTVKYRYGIDDSFCEHSSLTFSCTRDTNDLIVYGMFCASVQLSYMNCERLIN